MLHYSVRETALAISYGADALNLVSEMPSGTGIVSDELAAEITIPPGVSSFLLTSKQDARAIIEQQRLIGTDTIQIVDRLERDT